MSSESTTPLSEENFTADRAPPIRHFPSCDEDAVQADLEKQASAVGDASQEGNAQDTEEEEILGSSMTVCGGIYHGLSMLVCLFISWKTLVMCFGRQRRVFTDYFQYAPLVTLFCVNVPACFGGLALGVYFGVWKRQRLRGAWLAASIVLLLGSTFFSLGFLGKYGGVLSPTSIELHALTFTNPWGITLEDLLNAPSPSLSIIDSNFKKGVQGVISIVSAASSKDVPEGSKLVLKTCQREGFGEEVLGLHALQSLASEGIVPRLYQVEYSKQLLLMDFVEGIPVSELRDMNLLNPDWPRIVPLLAFQMMQVLRRIHALDVHHGDAHASNFLIERDSSTKEGFRVHLVDFGRSGISAHLKSPPFRSFQYDYVRVAQTIRECFIPFKCSIEGGTRQKYKASVEELAQEATALYSHAFKLPTHFSDFVTDVTFAEGCYNAEQFRKLQADVEAHPFITEGICSVADIGAPKVIFGGPSCYRDRNSGSISNAHLDSEEDSKIEEEACAS